MPIANVSLTDTFDLWRTRFNQTVQISNLITEGQHNTSGTITIANPYYYNGNVSLNVSNGFIRVQGNTFLANGLTLTSNSPTLRISGSGLLGTSVFFDIGTLSTDVFDSNTANIASANSVYKAYGLANAAIKAANAAYNGSNSVFNVANTAQYTANLAFDAANSSFNTSNTNFATSLNAANTAQYTANLAFDRANTAGGGYFRGNNGDNGRVANKQDIFRINTSNVTANMYFSAGENASATGPLYLDPSVTITINTGARVVII